MTAFDTNDLEKLGDPNAPEEPPPPEPEPTPPLESEPTPPPLDKPLEFEIPQATPSAAPTPKNSPKPNPTPAPHLHPQPAVKPAGTPSSRPLAASGLAKGSLTGAPDGTGSGGPRSGLLLRSPRPPYPSAALQMHISGDVHVTITVQGGNIVDAEGSGPPLLAGAAARWVRANWKFIPTANGKYKLPVSFVLH